MNHQFIIMCIILASPFASAHKITVDALYDDGKVYLECWLGTNEPAANATLNVCNAAGDIIHTATLDQDGTYIYSPTSAGTFTFTVDAHLGHKGTATLVIAGKDLPSITPVAESAPPSDHPSEVTNAAISEPSATPAPPPAKSSLRSTPGGLTTGEKTIIGLICIASLASAYLSYRNQSRIAALEEKLRARNLDPR